MVIKYASSCHPNDIQDAVDYVEGEGGGTTILPSDVGQWDNETVTLTPPGPGTISDVIGQGDLLSVLKQNRPAPFNRMFKLNGGLGGKSKLDLFGMEGLVQSSNDDVLGAAIGIEFMVDFLVNRIRFKDFPQTDIHVGTDASNKPCRGLIRNCDSRKTYKDVLGGGSWGYGIIVSSKNYWDWDPDVTHFLGKYEVPNPFPCVYVEGCNFYKTRHAIASNQLGWYVFRHNTVYQTNNSGVDVHGAGPAGAGGRGAEIYDNDVNAPVGIGMRGGSGVIYNNRGGPIWVMKDITGTPLRPMDHLYIYDNTASFRNYDGYYVENVNYFLRKPTQALDGFTYTPYADPHPLDSGIHTRNLLVRSSPVSNVPFVVRRV